MATKYNFLSILLLWLSCHTSVYASYAETNSSEWVIVWQHALFSGGQRGGAVDVYHGDVYTNMGFRVIVPVTGPVSSNWDRACEMYAQIKGTIVDYGVCHSRKYGHKRFGRDYTGQGLYPEWDETNRPHFISHSMGGQTIRMLELLLQEGSGCAEDTSPLFQGGKNYMRSLATFCSPHDGTTLMKFLGNTGIANFLKNALIMFAGISDETFIEDIYTFSLDHWEVNRRSWEPLPIYWYRLITTIMSTKDLASHDITEEGAREINNMGESTYPNTRYLSFAAARSVPKTRCMFWLYCWEYHTWDNDMTTFIKPFAALMGQSSEPEELRKNDGVVNFIYQICPSNDKDPGKDHCVEYDGEWGFDKWYYLDVDYLDHFQIDIPDAENDLLNYSFSGKKLNVDHALRLIALYEENNPQSPPVINNPVFPVPNVTIPSAAADMKVYAEEVISEQEYEANLELYSGIAMACLCAFAALFVVVQIRRRHLLEKAMDKWLGDDEEDGEDGNRKGYYKRFSKKYFGDNSNVTEEESGDQKNSAIHSTLQRMKNKFGKRQNSQISIADSEGSRSDNPTFQQSI